MFQSKEWLELKVVEFSPGLAELGSNLAAATEMQRAHQEVLLQLQVSERNVPLHLVSDLSEIPNNLNTAFSLLNLQPDQS